MTQRKVSIPLEAINASSAREKSIRRGHPSTLHFVVGAAAPRACRAILFAQLVVDPSSWPNRFPTEEDQDAERKCLHKIIERLVPRDCLERRCHAERGALGIARSVAWGLGEEPPPKSDGNAILDFLAVQSPSAAADRFPSKHSGLLWSLDGDRLQA